MTHRKDSFLDIVVCDVFTVLTDKHNPFSRIFGVDYIIRSIHNLQKVDVLLFPIGEHMLNSHTLTTLTIDTDMLVEHIRTLKSNVPIEHPVYSFVEHNRTSESVLVKPSRVIIVDGILIFENKALRELMDIKVFVDTDADIRLARRILRDVCERGRTMQSVIDQYTTTVKPMHEEFVEPSKRYADVIIPEGGFNSVAVGMLIQSIRSIIDNKESK